MRNSLATPVILSGTLLEWYDFTLFAYLAPLFAILFFPQHNSLAALMAIFSVYTSGNIARALSAIWFGQIGDTKGRQHALIYSILFMALPTLLIALMPTYARIGITASVLLALCRIMQGIAMGGEYQGNAIFLIEHSKQREGWVGSLIVTMIGLGMLMASGIVSVVTLPSMPEYAWRFAFLFGGTVALVALYVRTRLVDSHSFLLAKSHGEIVKIPLKTLIKQKPKNLLVAILISLGAASFNYSAIFLPTYFTLIHIFNLHDATHLLAISLLVGQFLTPLAGWFSDKKWLTTLKFFLPNPKRCENSLDNKLAMMLAGALLTLVLAYPCYWVYNQGNSISIICANLIIGTLSCLYLAPKNAVLTHLFPINIRYTGFGLGHNIGLALGSTTPVILIYAITKHHMIMAPAYYLMLSSAVSLLCLLIVWRHRDKLLA